MSTVQEINLSDLERRYLHSTRAQQAVGYLESLEGARGHGLVHLLRHHSEREEADKRELELRQAFDELLDFYSLVEVGCLAGFLPALLPEAFRERAIGHLAEPAVRSYYRQKYPLLLPSLALARAQGRQQLQEEGASAPSLFQQFLEVDTITEDDEVRKFLWLAEGGYKAQVGIEETVKLLRSPLRLAASVSKPDWLRNPVDASADGLRKFIDFCGHYARLLEDSREYPLLQSGMWWHREYWFRTLDARLAPSGEGAGGDLGTVVPYSGQGVHMLVAQFLEAGYGRVLEDVVRKLDEGWRDNGAYPPGV